MCQKSWKLCQEEKNRTLLCRQCTGVHCPLSSVQLNMKLESSNQYYLVIRQRKYFFSNNTDQVEDGPQPRRGGRSPRKA